MDKKQEFVARLINAPHIRLREIASKLLEFDKKEDAWDWHKDEMRPLTHEAEQITKEAAKKYHDKIGSLLDFKDEDCQCKTAAFALEVFALNGKGIGHLADEWEQLWKIIQSKE